MHFIWREVVRDLKEGMEEYEIIKGYHVRSKNNRKRNNEIYESNGTVGRDMKDGDTVAGWSDM